jgi:GNAT superfamily N-acetyltransferase
MSDVVAATPGPATAAARKATHADLTHVTDTLALAFYDDPVLMWIVEDGSRRKQLLPAFFGAVAASYLAHDETYATDDGVCAAVWAPPGAEDDEDLPAALGESMEECAPRLSEVLALMEAKHPVEPHYYLFLLGTRPGSQGRGLGTSLMAPVLETCDREEVPAYLEATSERNKQFYLRRGYEVTDEIHLPAGPTMWRMWRAPGLLDSASRSEKRR